MPQVSVMPANISPAPIKADSPAKYGCTVNGEHCTHQNQEAGNDSHLAFQRDRLLAANHRKSGGFPGECAPFDVHHIQPGRCELLARLLAAAAGTADHVEWLGRAVAFGHERLRIEPIQRHVTGKIDVDFAEFDRCSHIQQLDALACRAHFRQLLEERLLLS